jgi:tetratricopeptide (TPR) repeat protein
MTGDGTLFDDILALVASDFAAAEARLQDMARAEPDSFDAHFMLGFIHSRRQDYGAAAAALVRAVEIRPTVQVALFNLGYCRQQLGDLAGGLDYYRAALRASGGRYGGGLRPARDRPARH